MQLPKGSTLGSYRIEDFIASGGMGEIYKARHTTLERWVAIKILGEDIGGDEAALLRFRREAKSASRLEHPHICRVYDFGEDDDRAFLVLEYLEGETLKERIGRAALRHEEIIEFGAEIAEALDHAHRHGLVHRDLKPDNVMVTESGTKVLDFGIAKRSAPSDVSLGTEGGQTTGDTWTLTREGALIGTLPYMAPEQIEGGDTDARTDIYALGVMLYELIAGRRPFAGPTDGALAVAILRDSPEDLQTVDPSISVSLARAVHRCLEKDPENRWQTSGDLATELRAIHRAAAALSPAALWASLRRTSLMEAIGNHPIAAVSAVLVLAGGIAVTATLNDEEPSSVVVVPFHEPTSTEEERDLAVELADAITQELLNWDPVRSVSSVDLAGPRLDLGLGGSTLERIDDGLALAREVDAQEMLALTVGVRGDSAFLNAQLLDTRASGRVPLSSAGLIDSNFDIIAPIVAAVLGFGDAPGPGRAFQAGTRNPEAAAEYLSGLEELERSRLDQAEVHFRRAVALDATFASALTRLAQTLFWRIEEAPSSSAQPGPEILRLSTAAMDYLEGLSSQNSLHVRGFYAFQDGQYQEARTHYRAILDSNPADVYALLMTGEVEIKDKGMTRAQGGTLVPRSNLNLAMESFSETVRIRPTFELGYGQLFKIPRMLERALNLRACDIFSEARDRVSSSPSDGGTFCPVVQDSLTWMRWTEFDAADQVGFRESADRVFDRSVDAFRRWTRIAPEQPRAFDGLSDALLLERTRTVSAAPERLQLNAEEVLEYASRAAELYADTTSEQLLRLANLHLAAGQGDVAIDLARRAVDRYAAGPEGLSAAPGSLINLLVVSGQTSLALAVGSGYATERRVPVNGQSTPLVAEPLIQRIKALGAVGVHGPPLRTELDSLTSTWSIAGYSSEQQQILRNFVTLRDGIAASLVADSAALAEWGESITVEDPLWNALRLTYDDPASAEEYYARALDQEPGGFRPAPRAFILGSVSGKLGRHAEAIRHYSKLDSIPYGVNGFDAGWGLQVLSQLLRAELHERLGDLSAALGHFRSFEEARAWPDSLALPGLEQARRGIERVR